MHKENRKKIKKIMPFLIVTLLTSLVVGCNETADETSKGKEVVPIESKEKEVTNETGEQEDLIGQEEMIPSEDMTSQKDILSKEDMENQEEIVERPEIVFPTAEPGALLQKDELGHPKSSYGLGSATYLQGKNILVSLFLTDPDGSFSEEEKDLSLKKLSEATLYIEETAKKYDVETEFLYNWKEYPDLYQEAEIDFVIDGTDEALDKLDEKIAVWVENLIPYEELVLKYDTIGIATCIFVNHSGRSYAIVYDGEDNVKESLILFLKSKSENEGPETYAHEILHLFGAHDLYKDAEFTNEVTDYVKKTYPDEIMLQVNDMGEGVKQQISRITAYHLGWLDDIPELEEFPQLQRKDHTK